MSIISYISSLLPSFSKNKVVDDARLTYAELENNAVPSYAEAEKFFTNYKYRSQHAKDMSVVYKRICRNDSDLNMVVAISKNLGRILSAKDKIMKHIESEFEDEIITSGISSRKLNLIRILEVVSFLTDFSLLFLNYMYVLETAEQNKDTGYVRSNLSKAEVDHLNKCFTDFCLALNSLGRDKDKVEKAIDSIPDILLNIETGQSVVTTFSPDKLDPLSLHGFSSNTNNPIYHIRMMFAERQVAKFKRNKELKKVLELRVLNLMSLRENKEDAKLEKEIEYTQGRIQGLDHEIAKMEEGL